MGSARAILQKMDSDLELIQSNIPLDELERGAFLNALDDIQEAVADALAIVSPDEDWDVMGFEAFLARERERSLAVRAEGAIAHPQSPLAS